MESKFTGGAFGNFFRVLAVYLASAITLGIAYPFMECWYLEWKVQHTFINGKRLTFNGNGGEYFVKYIIWFLLSVITFGIYYIVQMKINLITWETEHTHIEGEAEAQSKFDGKWYQLLGVNFVSGLVTIITLFIGFFWAYCYSQRWYAKHKIINGTQLIFTGTGMQFFGKCILWELLTVVTLGIYSFWLTVNIIKWGARHTNFVNENANNTESTDAQRKKYLYLIKEMKCQKLTQEVLKTLRKSQGLLRLPDGGLLLDIFRNGKLGDEVKFITSRGKEISFTFICSGRYYQEYYFMLDNKIYILNILRNCLLLVTDVWLVEKVKKAILSKI